MKFAILAVFFVSLALANSSRILVYIPTPSISHQEPIRPLIQELVRRGHEVFSITTDPIFPKGQTPPNLTEIDLHDMSYTIIRNAFKDLPRGKKDDYVESLDIAVFKFFLNLIDKQLNTPEVQNVIRGRKFDLMILESIARPILGLTHIIKAPVILVSSLGLLFDNADVIGAPTHPILYPATTRQRLSNLSVWEKLSELYNQYRIMKMTYASQEAEDEMLRKNLGHDMPPLSELKNNVDMLFLNVHPIFEGNHPVPPSVIYIWGIHKKPRKELPEDLKKFLDSSRHGVIYMSFGTNTDPTTLSPDRIQMFVNVFCKLPYDVLWKWNDDELPGRCDKIKIHKWLPQSDLLRHPNIKLFVTQGGMQSTDESIAAGVPLIGFPMMGDQWYNVEKYVHLKIGLRLDFETFTEEQFKHAVTTVIQDESYRNNVKRLHTLMCDEPLPPLERAVWWVEHVLRHGGARHLRAPAANISWWQYFEIDLMCTVLFVCLIALCLIISILYYLYRFIRRNIFISGAEVKNNYKND